MAAVIHIRSAQGLDESPRSIAGSAPRLTVLDGGRSAASRRMRRVYLVRRLAAASVLSVLLAVSMSVAAAALGGGADAISLSSAAGAPSAVHVVEPGESLWSIAAGLEPAGDPRAMVQRLIELNESQDAPVAAGQLRIGQELIVPSGDG